MFNYLILLSTLILFSVSPSSVAGEEWGSRPPQPKGEQGAYSSPEHDIKLDTLDPDKPVKRKPYKSPPSQTGSMPAVSGLVVTVSADPKKMPDIEPWTTYFKKTLGFTTTNESLKAILGTLLGVDLCLYACTAEKMIKVLAKFEKKPISLLYILGHGSVNSPYIALCGSDTLEPKDVDMDGLQKEVRKYLDEMKYYEMQYCKIKNKESKPPEGETVAEHMEFLDTAHGRVTGELAKLRNRLALLLRLSDVMTKRGVIQLLNCSGASTDDHIKFVKMIGRVLMWKRGGSIWASKTDIGTGQVMPVGWKLGAPYSALNELIALAQKGSPVKPGEFYMVGDWVVYSIPREEKSPVDLKLLASLKNIENKEMPSCPPRSARISASVGFNFIYTMPPLAGWVNAQRFQPKKPYDFDGWKFTPKYFEHKSIKVDPYEPLRVAFAPIATPCERFMMTMMTTENPEECSGTLSDGRKIEGSLMKTSVSCDLYCGDLGSEGMNIAGSTKSELVFTLPAKVMEKATVQGHLNCQVSVFVKSVWQVWIISIDGKGRESRRERTDKLETHGSFGIRLLSKKTETAAEPSPSTRALPAAVPAPPPVDRSREEQRVPMVDPPQPAREPPLPPPLHPKPQPRLSEDNWQSIHEDASSLKEPPEEPLERRKKPKGHSTKYGF
jgi:hypothetical protein